MVIVINADISCTACLYFNHFSRFRYSADCFCLDHVSNVDMFDEPIRPLFEVEQSKGHELRQRACKMPRRDNQTNEA
jgi:hypothetical protein